MKAHADTINGIKRSLLGDQNDYNSTTLDPVQHVVGALSMLIVGSNSMPLWVNCHFCSIWKYCDRTDFTMAVRCMLW